MKRHLFSLVATSLLVCGCAVGEPEEGPVAEADEPALTANALTADALYPSPIVTSALAAGALSATRLPANALAAIQDPGPGGASSRLLLRYLVTCALGSAQGFSFSWTDDQQRVHNETYAGQLAIEPGWASQALSPPGQRMVSACLLARVNYYGTSVTISVRSIYAPLPGATTSAEIAAYPHLEGAFWGNLFLATPWAYACHDAANADNSRQRLRECAIGHLNADGTTSSCGIIQRLGECTALGATIDAAGQYYLSCPNVPGATDKTTNYVITTALP